MREWRGGELEGDASRPVVYAPRFWPPTAIGAPREIGRRDRPPSPDPGGSCPERLDAPGSMGRQAAWGNDGRESRPPSSVRISPGSRSSKSTGIIASREGAMVESAPLSASARASGPSRTR